MESGRAHIGISGWNFPAWKRGFYAGIPQRDWLRHCAGSFSGIEVNATFFRFLKPEMFAQWRDQTPSDFRFALKGHRFVTHIQRLREVEPLIARMRLGALALGDRLSAVVWQIPRNLAKDTALLENFADGLKAWPEARHAVEFRHSTWFDEEIAALMQVRRLAVCQTEGAEWPLWPQITTDMVYVRLSAVLGGAPRDIESWAGRARVWLDERREVHLYIEDSSPQAPYDAARLAARLR